jgi:hypothetical protein
VGEGHPYWLLNKEKLTIRRENLEENTVNLKINLLET